MFHLILGCKYMSVWCYKRKSVACHHILIAGHAIVIIVGHTINLLKEYI